MEIMQQRMMESVPKADVVITNPTHYAVAIRYDRGNNHAPEVVAKGTDDVALRIREIAKENDVPRMEDPAARARAVPRREGRRRDSRRVLPGRRDGPEPDLPLEG